MKWRGNNIRKKNPSDKFDLLPHDGFSNCLSIGQWEHNRENIVSGASAFWDRVENVSLPGGEKVRRESYAGEEEEWKFPWDDLVAHSNDNLLVLNQQEFLIVRKDFSGRWFLSPKKDESKGV